MATPSSSTSATAATSSAAARTLSAGSNLKVVGIILAIISGVLIGASFVFKKKGLIRSQGGGEIGEGVAYLKSALWWIGMIMMIIGEICNFAAYAFVEAIVVTPLGALSVVICAILSSIFLNEKLSFFGWLGCTLCILGSIIIALNGPKDQTIGEVREFQKLFLAPGFLSFVIVLILISLVIIFYFAPKYGKKSMLWYISVCSMIGGISVSVTTGLGAAIVQTALGNNQFRYWFMYFLLGFVIITLLVEVYYLNVALALFNTAMVTPTYYVLFTFFTMVTTVVLFQGLHASAAQILTIVVAFLVICVGITILQMSKVDPAKLSKLDRRSTILLQAARERTGTVDEKGVIGVEDPGLDTLRGSFGTIGSIIRARTYKSQRSHVGNESLRALPPGAAAPYPSETASWSSGDGIGLGGLQRHQLYDAPVPRPDDAQSVNSQLANKRPTIKFGEEEVVHSYSRPGIGDNSVSHEHRRTAGSVLRDGYPPLPQLPTQTDSPKQEKLLEIDSPDLNKSSLAVSPQLKEQKWNLSMPEEQTLVIPALLGTESEIRSAPPSLYAPRNTQGSSPTGRKNLRELFAKSAGSSVAPTDRETLLSFPSLTDSAPSEWEVDRYDGDRGLKAKPTLESLQVDVEKPRERQKSQPRTPKKYPKVEDDMEERVSLWQREESDTGTHEASGIRLVQPGAK